MTRYLSNKLRVVSFVQICMVVLLHAQIFQLSPHGISEFVQHLITGRITRIAVPFFFVISGFLFAYTIDERQKTESIKRKITKRVRTLLIPYIVWSITCLLLVCILQFLWPSITGTSKLIVNYNFNDYIKEIIISPSIAYQLWFIRDLFIVSFFAPVLIFLIKYLRGFLIILLVVLNITYWAIGFLSTTSITFFSIGLYLAIYHKDWPETIISNQLWSFIPIFWIIINIVLEYLDVNSSLIYLANEMIGIISAWIAYDLLYKKCIERWLTLDIFSFSFLIYILHEPILTLLKKIYIRVIGVDTAFTSLALYFLCPFVLIAGIITIGRLLKHHIPKIYSLLTGNR